MDFGQVTVKEMLAKRLGEEKASKILVELGDAYQSGKRGDELEKHFKNTLKKENAGSDITSVTSTIVEPGA